MSFGLEQYFKEALLLDGDRLNAILAGRERSHIPAVAIQAALQIKAPMLKAAQAQQAAQQPKQPTVRDQVLEETSPQPQMSGLAAADAGEMMTPKAMAAGGIVAFDEGGEVPRYNGTEDSLVGSPFSRSPFGREWYKGAEAGAAYEERQKLINAITEQYGPKASLAGFFSPQSDEDRKKAKDVMSRLNSMSTDELRSVASTVPNAPVTQQKYIDVPHPGGYEGVNASVSDIPSAPPTDKKQQTTTDKTQQTPSDGLTQYKPQTSFPAVDRAMGNLRKTYGDYETFDPMQQLANFDVRPYAQFLPKTAEDIRTQRSKAEAELRKMYPETREAAEEMMAKRYAGLEEMFKKREARGEEALKEAEKEKGQTAGIGLIQLADQLVRKPAKDIDTSAAFQTFKDANKSYTQARKDFNASKDKIDEARELQKIGQFEKADALYREGAKGLFDFKNTTAQLEDAQDAMYKSGALSLAGKGVQARADQLAKKVELGKSEVETALGLAGLQSAERRTAMQSAAEVEKYRMLAPDRAAKTVDIIRDNAEARYKNWVTNEGKLEALKPGVADAKRQQFLREEYLANGYTPEQIAKLLGAPSGGGAQPVIDFTTGKPMGQ